MFFKLDELLMAVDLEGGLEKEGSAYFLTNGRALITLASAARQLRVYNEAADMYNRKFMEFKGLPILNAGWKPAGAVDGTFPAGGAAGNLVIGNDSEAVTTTNGGNAYDKQTPVYVVRTGEQYVHGLQVGPVQTKDLGEDTSASPYYRKYLIRHVHNAFTPLQKRAVARVVGLNFSGVSS